MLERFLGYIVGAFLAFCINFIGIGAIWYFLAIASILPPIDYKTLTGLSFILVAYRLFKILRSKF